MDAALLNHLCHEVLSLFLVNSQEVAKLIKVNVHVNATDHYDVVLNQGFLKYCVAISHGHVLVILELLEELLNMCLPNDLTNKHFLEEFKELA